MTEKRFKVNPMADGRGNIWYGLFDNNQSEYICDAWNGAERCCRLLNEQHEQIEKIKLKGLKVLDFYLEKLKTTDDFQGVRDEIWIVKQVLFEMGVIE